MILKFHGSTLVQIQEQKKRRMTKITSEIALESTIQADTASVRLGLLHLKNKGRV